jgi:NitT/TauT family transport system substrate-binding protein
MKPRLFSIFISLLILLSSALSIAKPIKIGIDLWPGYYPLVLAKHLGLFKKHGLQVDIVLPESTDNMLGQFIDGDLDMVCVAMGDAFSLYNKDNDLRVVMITDESAGGDALVGQIALREKSLKWDSLKGKRIGTNLNGFGELFVRRFLANQGADPDTVSFVQLEAADALNALQYNKVDIAHTWEPYVSEILSFNKGTVVFDSSQTPGLIPDALLANGPFIKNNPEQLKLFIKAWLEAAQWWLENPAQGNALIESELVMMPDSVSLKGVKLYDKHANLKAFKAGQGMDSIFHVTQMYIDFFTAKGIVKAGLKPEDIIDGQFLPE